jgi:hypothetical protein
MIPPVGAEGSRSFGEFQLPGELNVTRNITTIEAWRTLNHGLSHFGA